MNSFIATFTLCEGRRYSITVSNIATATIKICKCHVEELYEAIVSQNIFIEV